MYLRILIDKLDTELKGQPDSEKFSSLRSRLRAFYLLRYIKKEAELSEQLRMDYYSHLTMEQKINLLEYYAQTIEDSNSKTLPGFVWAIKQHENSGSYLCITGTLKPWVEKNGLRSYSRITVKNILLSCLLTTMDDSKGLNLFKLLQQEVEIDYDIEILGPVITNIVESKLDDSCKVILLQTFIASIAELNLGKRYKEADKFSYWEIVKQYPEQLNNLIDRDVVYRDPMDIDDIWVCSGWTDSGKLGQYLSNMAAFLKTLNIRTGFQVEKQSLSGKSLEFITPDRETENNLKCFLEAIPKQRKEISELAIELMTKCSDLSVELNNYRNKYDKYLVGFALDQGKTTARIKINLELKNRCEGKPLKQVLTELHTILYASSKNEKGTDARADTDSVNLAEALFIGIWMYAFEEADRRQCLESCDFRFVIKTLTSIGYAFPDYEKHYEPYLNEYSDLAFPGYACTDLLQINFKQFLNEFFNKDENKSLLEKTCPIDKILEQTEEAEEKQKEDLSKIEKEFINTAETYLYFIEWMSGQDKPHHMKKPNKYACFKMLPCVNFNPEESKVLGVDECTNILADL